VSYGLVVSFGSRTCKHSVWKRGCARRRSRALGPVGLDVANAVRVTLVVDGLVQRFGRDVD
jgi:hypothetical protein